MKYKFFLSLSLLTAFVSVQATEVFTTADIPGLAPSYVAKLNAKKFMSIVNTVNKVGTIGAVATVIGLFSAVSSAVNYFNQPETESAIVTSENVIAENVFAATAKTNDFTEEVKSEEVKSEDATVVTWKDTVTNAAITAKNNTVNAYNSAAKFATKSAYHKVGTGTAVAALVGAVYYLASEASN